MPLYVYLIQCADGSFYTGVTNSLARRMSEHNSNVDPNSYVFGRAPVELKWSRHFESEMEAIYAEKQIKRWSRAKKQALISGDIKLLKALSESKN